MEKENNYKSLIFAIECNNEKAVRDILESGVCPNEDPDNPEATLPTNLAVIQENWAMVKTLIQHGGYVKLPMPTYNATALHYAAITRQKNLVEQVLSKRNKQCRDTDSKGATVLHMLFQLDKLKNQNSQQRTKVAKRPDNAEEDNIIDIARIFLNLGVSVNARTSSGKSPLYLAIKRGMRRVAEFLLNNGADVNVRDKRGNSLIHLLVCKEHERLSCSLTFAAQPSSSSDSMAAVVQEDTSFIEYLRSKGAQLNWANAVRKTPMNLAMEYRLHDTFLLLFNHLDTSHHRSMDPKWLHLLLDSAGGDAHWKQLLHNERVVWTMVDMCNNINGSHNGETLLTLLLKSCIDPNTGAHEEAYEAIARLLISREADVNQRNADNVAPVQLASRYKHAAILQLLKDNGADFEVYSREGDSLLHIAAERSNELQIGDLEWVVTEFLICQAGCRVAEINSAGMTALHVAARSGNVGAATSLIAHGADINCLEPSLQRSPLLLAVGSADRATLDLLIKNGAELNLCDAEGSMPLHLAVSTGSVEVVTRLIELGVDVQAVAGPSLWTPLHTASRTPGRRAVIEALILSGADPSGIDAEGMSALHVAVQYGAIDNARALLDLGLDVDQRNPYSLETSLHVCARTGDVDAAELLISRGGDVNARNNDDQTPLHVAASVDDALRPELFKILVRSGAYLDARDNFARSPLTTAVQFVSCGNVRELVTYNPSLDDICDNFDMFVDIVNHDPQTKHGLARHMTKLKLVNLPVPAVHENLGWKFNSVQKDLIQDCLKEVKAMKVYILDQRVSLYELLHLPCHSNLAYLHYDLLALLDIETKFPIYHGFIWKRYRHFVDRASMLGSAKLTLDRIARKDMPERCVNCLCSFLDNEHLKHLLESAKF